MDPNARLSAEYLRVTDTYKAPGTRDTTTPAKALPLSCETLAEIEAYLNPPARNNEEGSGSESEDQEESGTETDTPAGLELLQASAKTKEFLEKVATIVASAKQQSWGAAAGDASSITSVFTKADGSILSLAEINEFLKYFYQGDDRNDVVFEGGASADNTLYDDGVGAVVTAAGYRILHFARLRDCLETWGADTIKGAFRRATTVHPNELESALSAKNVTLLNPSTRVGYSAERYASEENADIVIVKDNVANLVAVQTGSSDEYSDYDVSFYGGSFYGGFGYY